jgi:poly(3-hydroxybutyrate) depolymerase
LLKTLRKCPFTVNSLMKSFAPISLLVMPCQTNPVPLPGSGSVSGVRYPGTTNHAEVIIYSVAGGGHTWPGGKPMPVAIVGKTTPDIDSTRLMWSFFTENPLVR